MARSKGVGVGVGSALPPPAWFGWTGVVPPEGQPARARASVAEARVKARDMGSSSKGAYLTS